MSKPNPRLVPLATQLDKTQLLIKKTTTAEKPHSPSHSDLEAHGEPEDEPPVDSYKGIDPYKGLMAIKKEFTPDLVALGKEFDLERNRVKREAYRANHTLDQKKEVLVKWKEFMKEISSNVHFFEYFENYFEWHKKSCVVTKTNWTKEETKEAVRSSLAETTPPSIVRSNLEPSPLQPLIL